MTPGSTDLQKETVEKFAHVFVWVQHSTLFIIIPTFVRVPHFKDLCDFTSRFQQTSVCCGAAKCLTVSHGLLCPLVAGSATRNAELSNALNDL